MANFHINALEKAKHGEWDVAHDLVQHHTDEYSCLIHGYLHRVEGDNVNAKYWYSRTGHTMPDNPLDDEWLRLYEIVK